MGLDIEYFMLHDPDENKMHWAMDHQAPYLADIISVPLIYCNLIQKLIKFHSIIYISSITTFLYESSLNNV